MREEGNEGRGGERLSFMVESGDGHGFDGESG